MTRYLITAVAAAGVLFSGGARAQEPTTEAKIALANLQKLAAQSEKDPRIEEQKIDGLRRLGFASKEELLSARLAAPVQVYMVQLDKLRAYRPDSDSPSGLLNAVDTQIFPMQVGQTAKASIFIDRGRLSSYGSPQLTQRLDRIRAVLIEQTGLPEDAFFLVNLPALNARFVGHYQKSDLQKIYRLRESKRLMLTALHDVKLPIGSRDDRYAYLAAGKVTDADVVFRTLLEPARNLDVSVPR